MQPSNPSRGILFLGGLGLGAGLMYLLDPDRGARRRSLLRDKMRHTMRVEKEVVNKGVRDLGHRATGIMARLRSLRQPEQVSDEKLVERVRARMGRSVSHAGAIEVTARDGHVTVSGPIFANEVGSLLRAVRRVPGVHSVDNRLEPHTGSGSVPGLQGSGRRPARPMFLRESWPPAARLMAGSAGLAGGAYGLHRGDTTGYLVAGVCTALLVRSATNMPSRRLVGVRSGRRAIDLRKTITVDAPIDQVFDFWARFENFPQFMEHVREVRVSEDRKRSHWKVEGPGGTTISWDAQLTSSAPGKVLAWKSMPGATVEHAGIVRFEPAGDDRTRLDIRMSYNPPAGAIGHAVAKLFRKDPKTAMDEDMVRLKTLLEGRSAPTELEQAIEPLQPQPLA